MTNGDPPGGITINDKRYPIIRFTYHLQLNICLIKKLFAKKDKLM